MLSHHTDSNSNGGAPGMLRSFAERIVRLKIEIKDLQSDAKGVASEAASQGFDKKALSIVVARMMEDESDRAKRLETEALSEVYLASLGMLDGTPLGDATRRRMDAPPPPPPPETGGDRGDVDEEPGPPMGEAHPPADEAAPGSVISQADIDSARNEGETAGRDGIKIFANPYVAGDPRRAAWDEGWCRGTGSDGMDLPLAFRRRPKAATGGKPADAGR